MSPHPYYHRQPPDPTAPKLATAPPAPAPPPPASPPAPSLQAPSLGQRLEAKPVPPTSAQPAASAPLRPFAIPPPPPMRPAHWGMLGAIVVIALWLRLRDALSVSVIGAEDPYLHMERTWNLLSGQGVDDYPIGLMVLLSPFAMMGPDVFYAAVRFLPAFIGTGGVVAVFFLCRPYLHPTGGLTATLILAVLPEHIRRTNLMFPTAIDLAILPILVLALMRAFEGRRWGWPTVGMLGFVLLMVHPWSIALVVPPLAAFAFFLLVANAQTRRLAVSVAGGSMMLFAGVLFLLPSAGPGGRLVHYTVPRFGELLQNPAGVFPLPPFVDLGWMLTVPVLILGAVGFGLAFVRRSRLTVFALIWVAFMLPLVIVDWFGMSWLPHRIVAYMTLGFVILAALPVIEVVRLLEASTQKAAKTATFGVLGLVLVVLLPSAMALPPWYRVYDEQDFEAWDAVSQRDPEIVMAGSWQARTGYRALTGGAAVYNPDFFRDERMREWELERYPNMIVVVDDHTSAANLTTDFLADWRLLGQWGDTKAYERP